MTDDLQMWLVSLTPGAPEFPEGNVQLWMLFFLSVSTHWYIYNWSGLYLVLSYNNSTRTIIPIPYKLVIFVFFFGTNHPLMELIDPTSKVVPTFCFGTTILWWSYLTLQVKLFLLCSFLEQPFSDTVTWHYKQSTLFFLGNNYSQVLVPTLFFFGITIRMCSYSWHTTDKVVFVLFCRITTLYYSYCALQIKWFLCCYFSDQLSAGVGLYSVVSLNAYIIHRYC